MPQEEAFSLRVSDRSWISSNLACASVAKFSNFLSTATEEHSSQWKSRRCILSAISPAGSAVLTTTLVLTDSAKAQDPAPGKSLLGVQNLNSFQRNAERAAFLVCALSHLRHSPSK